MSSAEPEMSARRSTGSTRRPVAWTAVLGLAVTVVVVSWLGIAALGDRAEGATERRESVSRVAVRLDRGDVLVRGGGRSITIAHTRTWRLHEPRVESWVDGSTLMIEVSCPRLIPVVGACWSSLDLTLPRRAHLDITTGAGSVTVDGFEGPLHVTTFGGSVIAEGLESPELAVDSHGGDLDLELVEPTSRVVLASAGGDVRLKVPGGPYDVDLSTVGGEARVGVRVDEHAEARITIASDGGSVAVAQPALPSEP